MSTEWKWVVCLADYGDFEVEAVFTDYADAEDWAFESIEHSVSPTARAACLRMWCVPVDRPDENPSCYVWRGRWVGDMDDLP